MSRKGENITRRKDGRWEARLICGHGENGRAQYRYLYADTYAEARAKKEYEQARLLRGESVGAPGRLSLGALFEEFLLHKSTTVKVSTLAHYRCLYAAYLGASIGGERLARLTPIAVERYALGLLQTGGRNGEGLSPKTVRDVLTLLRAVLRYAVMRGYVSPSKLQFSLPRSPLAEIAVLGREEQRSLEESLRKTPSTFKLGVFLTLYTGLRLGELCALRWSDIDLLHAELHVVRTIQRIPTARGCRPSADTVEGSDARKTAVLITEPKTPAARRCIPLPAFLVRLLSTLRPPEADGTAYILTGNHAYIEPSNCYMRYTRLLRRLGIRHYTFHALRHTFATRCIESGFDAKSLSEILGHADIRITLGRYVHPSMDFKRQCMEGLTALFLPTEGERMYTPENE